jgi:signal transduction histidine kinase
MINFTDSNKYQKNYWTLKFKEPDLEHLYQSTFAEQIHRLRIITSFLAIVVYCGFGILDYIISDNYLSLWFQRAIVGVPVLIMLAFFSVSRFYASHHWWVYPIAAFVVSLSIILMTATQKEVVEFYYAGIIIALFYCVMLFFISFIPALWVCLSSLSIYVLTVKIIAFVNVADKIFISNMFFLSSAILLCIASAYFFDLYNRNLFVARCEFEEKAEMAKVASKAKADFLALMSHELRSPLISVCGGAELMEYQVLGSDLNAYQTYIEDIRNGANHLLNIIDQIINFSTVSTGQRSLHEVSISSKKLIEDSLFLIKGKIEDNHINVQVEIERSLLLRIDEHLSHQMLVSIIVNAIKFSPQQSTITIQQHCYDDGSVEITIIDQGIGISPQDVEHITQPFVQLNKVFVRPKGQDGTGLGLALVNEIIKLHGGKLLIDSSQKIGTKVSVIFPASRVFPLLDAL